MLHMHSLIFANFVNLSKVTAKKKKTNKTPVNMGSLPSPSLFANPFVGRVTWKRKGENRFLVFISSQGRFSKPERPLAPGNPPGSCLVSSCAFGNLPQIIYIFPGVAMQSEGVFIDPLRGMNNTGNHN